MLRGWAFGVGLVVAAAVPAAAQPPPSSQPGQPGQPDPIDPKPVGIVVLVDESGSLRDDGVRAEQAAAAVLAQSEFSAGSQVAVLGFGGRTKESKQSPVRTVCQRTSVADGPARDYLARCTGDLHARTPAEGNATDFPSAISQGLSTLAEMPAVSARLMFLLTDGRLDVTDDESYGPDSRARMDEARNKLGEYLNLAAQRDVQVWPLGFGQAVQGELDAFAAGGSQRTCAPKSPKPRARIATDIAKVVASLADAYAAARCAGSNPPVSGVIVPGGSVDLHVEVPVTATDGSIAVHKGNAAITVAYLDPSGKQMPKSGTQNDSEFQVSGESTQVEALRIRNPVPGPWTVRLTAPPGLASETVSAIVIWQGAVRSSITLQPVTPRPGEVATVELTLRSRKGALADAAALRDVSASALFSGAGFTETRVDLSPGPGGKFTGQVTVPTTGTGALRLVGSVSGPGIATDERPWVGSVDQTSATLRAQTRFDFRRVEPGATLDGTVVVSNETGTARRVRLQLSDLDANSLVTVTPSEADVAPSGNTPIPFRLAFDPRTKLGNGQATLRVLDSADQTRRPYGEGVLTFEVGYPPPPPTLFERWRWVLLALALLVLAGAGTLLVRWRRRRLERDVRGLQARLYRDGRQIAYLSAPDEPSTRFGFTVRDMFGEPLRLDHATGAGESYVVQRGEAGGVRLRTPEGEEWTLRATERAELPSGIELAVHDSRAKEADPRTGPRWFRRSSVESDQPTEDYALPAAARQQPEDDLL